MAAKCKWEGLSGTIYTYNIYPIGEKFNAVAGNYIFAYESSPKVWSAVYIGQTSNLEDRFDDHHQAECILNNGATHIHVHSSSNDANVRRAEETDLIDLCQPPCNGQTAFY